ncbi:kinesin-like protein subito isoform X2 [Megalopta genalis]|uniref:kinesin-like protein subito isoform X2 n=1 Tax=Megalopta genalis TaxID=115081 RepID=UPI003FD4D535
MNYHIYLEEIQVSWPIKESGIRPSQCTDAHYVNSDSEPYQILMAGQYNLKVTVTAVNSRSSRSTFCNLVGSEHLKKILNIRDKLKEAQNINTSLLVLGRRLKMIHNEQLSKQKPEHIGPFRDSKLTRLFQTALSDKEHMAVIVNINLLTNLYTETQNVPNLATIVKKIVLQQKQKVYKKKSQSIQIEKVLKQ